MRFRIPKGVLCQAELGDHGLAIRCLIPGFRGVLCRQEAGAATRPSVIVRKAKGGRKARPSLCGSVDLVGCSYIMTLDE